jgi:hypothetical protein
MPYLRPPNLPSPPQGDPSPIYLVKVIEATDLQAVTNEFLVLLPSLYPDTYPVLVELHYSPPHSVLVLFALFNVEDPNMLPPP